MVLSGYEPKEVFHYFEQISAIPRGSGNEAAVAEYILAFARERGLWAAKDAYNNVIVKKPGTPGYENAQTVILQGHLDIVCEKNNDVTHDFMTDPIKLRVVGDDLYATGTTLGADNGVAVAIALAVLASSDLPHPPVEALFTASEEIGLLGARDLDASQLSGKILLSMDSSTEGKLCTSCAGGTESNLRIKTEYADAPVGAVCCELKISGLVGGHSGIEIIKERANANRLLARALNELNEACGVDIVAINGGAKTNAITREAGAVVFVGDMEKAAAVVGELQSIFAQEFRVSDPDVKITLERAAGNATRKCFSKSLTNRIITALMLIPNGAQAMNLDIPGLVETSNNIGVIVTGDDYVTIKCSTRSSLASRKYFIRSQIKLVAEMVSAEFVVKSDYPAWEFMPESPLRDVMTGVYERLFGKKPLIAGVHAGLECGYFSKKLEGADIVSYGAEITDAHSPNEHVSIASIGRVWEFTKEVLKNLS